MVCNMAVICCHESLLRRSRTASRKYFRSVVIASNELEGIGYDEKKFIVFRLETQLAHHLCKDPFFDSGLLCVF